MDAALLFRRLADVIDRRRERSPGSQGDPQRRAADAGANPRPPGPIARIWQRLKNRAHGRSDAAAPAAAPAAATLAVQVAFMGDLPSIIGERGQLVTLPQGATVAELFASLSGTYGEAFTSRVFRSPGRLHPTMLVLIDGENINAIGGLASKLGNSEVEVIMLPIIEGG